jgi:hypothetical protein
VQAGLVVRPYFLTTAGGYAAWMSFCEMPLYEYFSELSNR